MKYWTREHEEAPLLETILRSSGRVVALRTVTAVLLSLPVKYKQLPVVQLEESSDTFVNISFQFISLEEKERMY